MPSYPHVIRQQHFHVEMCGTECEGLALQSSLPELCQYRLAPVIEQVFERYAPPNEHLSIERLEIDAGTLTLDRLEHDLAGAVSQALEKALEEQMPLREKSSAAGGNKLIQLKTQQQAIHDAFIYFLTTGGLPWSFRLPASKNLEQAILDSWREARESGLDLYAINTALFHTLGSATVRKRLIRQFSPVFMEMLLSRLSSEGKTAMDGILQILGASDKQAAALKPLEQQLWETAFAGISIGKVLTVEHIVGETWRILSLSGDSAQRTSLTSLLERHWPEVIKKPAENRMAPAEALPSELDGLERPRQDITNTSAVPTKNAAQQRLDLDISAIKLLGISDSAEISEGLYIDGAGLVLLHPFLPRFFEALGIAAEDALLQSGRALCLLHFLTTGQSIAPEYALVLPKILCNVPLEVPVDSNITLTDAEREEAAALLEAVIRHWEVLRNTSADGLRGAFLLRPGKISLRDDGDWLLQVEAKSFDILLEQLPWGIGMVKLPWMETMLWVEWR